MRVLTVFAHPDRHSFYGAVLDRFQDGLKEAGHDYAGIRSVEHKHLWVVPSVGPETRQRYLEKASQLGCGYAD